MEWQREGVPFLPKTFPQQVNGAEVSWIIDGRFLRAEAACSSWKIWLPFASVPTENLPQLNRDSPRHSNIICYKTPQMRRQVCLGSTTSACSSAQKEIVFFFLPCSNRELTCRRETAIKVWLHCSCPTLHYTPCETERERKRGRGSGGRRMERVNEEGGQSGKMDECD